MESLLSIISLIISGLFGITGTLFFYKANRKKANAEAESTEITNLDSMQKIYQEIIFDQKKEMNELRERVKEMEVILKDYKEMEIKLKGLCLECKYKQFYEKNN